MQKNKIQILCHLVFVTLIGMICNACFVVNGKYWDVREPYEAMNPTEYVFDFPIQTVRGMIDSCFDLSVSERFKDIYVRKLRSDLFKLIHAEEFQSYVFRDKKGNYLPMIVYPVLMIDSLGENQTMIQVKSKSHTQVAGKRFVFFNPERFSMWAMCYKREKSSTIEEYEILRYLGKRLGQMNMPPIHYPKAMTLEEVKSRFSYFPFSESDLEFGK